MRRFMAVVALAVLPPVVVVLVLAAKFHALTAPEAMERAQLARHLAAGDGFVTSVVRPLSLLFQADVAKHADLYHAPVQPALLSLFFKVLHPSDRVTAGAMCLVWIVSVWLTYAVGRAWCNARTANFSALFYGSSVTALTAAAQGLPYALLGVEVLLAVWAAVPNPRHSNDEAQPDLPTPLWRIALAGLIAGAAFLTHYLMIVLAVVLAAVGIYGAMSYSVEECTREFGIRMALGATRKAILALTLGRAAMLSLIGLSFGVAVSLVLGRL